MMYSTATFLLLTSMSLTDISAFLVPAAAGSTTHHAFTRIGTNSPSLLSTSSTAIYSSTDRPNFDFSFEIPKKGIADVGTAEVALPPLLETSDVVVVRYALPFGLNAEPDKGNNSSGQVQVVVTKDGEGGEKVGDILRQTTYWRGREPGIFDVSKNAENFDLVVQALVTNDLSVADDIVLVFERPL
jgi:hypothetical protein